MLQDIQITEAAITYQQSIQNAQQVFLKKIAFGIKFENLNQYLPAAFNNLQSISSRAAIYQPHIPPVQVALEIAFKFNVTVGVEKSITLDASFATEPALAENHAVGSHNFTVSLQAQSDVIGTTEDGIALGDFLGVLGLLGALKAIQDVTILNSILSNIQLKQIILALNSSSKEIKSFVLKLLMFNWVIIPGKFRIEKADVTMNYIDDQWATKFDATASFSDEDFVDVHFELNDGLLPSKFSFTNHSSDFTIGKFLDAFNLDGLDSIPVVEQFLKIAVTEASIQIYQESSGTVKVTEGKISLYAESIEIGALFKLSQVDATIGFILDPTQNAYVFGFAVRGFINNKVYLDVAYDHYTSSLDGNILISTFSEASVLEVLGAVNSNGTDALSKNAAFSRISQSPTVNITIKIKYMSNDFKITNLIIHLNKELLIGPVILNALRFECHNDLDDKGPQQSYKLAGELVSEKNLLGAVLEFDVSKDTTGERTIIASLKPLYHNSLTLRSFLSVLDIASPPLPEIKGQTLPLFFDIALTKGIVSLSVASFQVVSFQIEISTVNRVTILDSPLIKLDDISLQVNYDSNTTPVTKAFLLGTFTIGKVQFKLKGSREEDGTIFSLATDWKQNSVGAQDSFNQLKPNSIVGLEIPSGIGIPQNFEMVPTRLDIQLLYNLKKRSLDFRGVSNLNWPIDLGFQQFTVKQLGSVALYNSSIDENKSEFKVYLTGQFQFLMTLLLACELHFGSEVDTVLSTLAAEDKINIALITDDVLGFGHPKEANTEGIAFQSLLPNSVQPMNFSRFFANINFTQSIFLCFGELASIGHGFLISGKLSAESNVYGYVLGISFPNGFKFSKLIPGLLPIDEILTIHKASCLIVSLQHATVKELVEALKSAQGSAVVPQDNETAYPFKP